MNDKYEFDEINNLTGFANGDKFSNDDEVRQYFTVENMLVMFGECHLTNRIKRNA